MAGTVQNSWSSRHASLPADHRAHDCPSLDSRRDFRRRHDFNAGLLLSAQLPLADAGSHLPVAFLFALFEERLK
jgi:hypothetical protein